MTLDSFPRARTRVWLMLASLLKASLQSKIKLARAVAAITLPATSRRAVSQSYKLTCESTLRTNGLLNAKQLLNCSTGLSRPIARAFSSNTGNNVFLSLKDTSITQMCMLHFWRQTSMLFWAGTFPHYSRKDYLLTSKHQSIENAIAQDLIILLSIGDEDVAALEEEAGRKFVYAIRFTVICVLLGMAIKIFPSLGRYFLFLCTCTAKKQGCTLFWQQLFSFNMLCTELHHANSILSAHSSWN